MLTGIRFFAAMHVVLYHNLYLIGENRKLIPAFILSFVKKGDTAVSFFFMLSGFILAYVYKDKLSNKQEKINYLITRIAKLYPLYFLAILLDIPRVSNYFFNTYPWHIALTKFLVSFVVSLAMIQSWIPNITPVWNAPAWSLSCEIFFYVCFIPLLLKILNFRHKLSGTLLCYFIPLFLYYFINSCSSFDFNIPFNNVMWRSLPLFRVSEFLIGIFLYGFALNKGTIFLLIAKYRSIIFWLSLIISFCITITVVKFPNEIYAQALLLPFFAFIILCSYFDDIYGGAILKSTTVVLLGNTSYAIYIFHQPLKYYFELFLSPNITTAILYVIGLIIISFLCYKYLEEPMRVRIKQMITTKN